MLYFFFNKLYAMISFNFIKYLSNFISKILENYSFRFNVMQGCDQFSSFNGDGARGVYF